MHSSPSQGEVENLEVVSVPMRKTSPRYRTLGLGIALIATLLLGWTGRNVEFDANLAHLNYLSSEQRTLFGELAQLRQADTLHEPLYIAHRARTLEEALALREQKESTIAPMIRKVKGATVQSVAPYLASAGEQAARLARWKAFVQENGTALLQQTAQEAAKLGFAPQAFASFDSLLRRDFRPINAAQCLTMGEDALAPLVARDGKGQYIVTTVVNVPRGEAEALKQQLDDALKQSMSHAKVPKAVEEDTESVWTFTPKSMNESVARHLSQDFSYIGWVCGAIVFGFLWLSFRRFSVAVLAFFPMVVSWLWILGSMSVFGLSFNLVNVILATFIFGQGDDYSIFVTEGLLYEYTYGRKLLAAYKRSILLSAVIMLIGVGTLAFAQHPALSSLGGLTIVGMGSVVAATLLLPAPVFSWWTRQHVASPWASPLSLLRLVQSALSRNVWALTHCCGIVWEDYTQQNVVADQHFGTTQKEVGEFRENVGDFHSKLRVFSEFLRDNLRVLRESFHHKGFSFKKWERMEQQQGTKPFTMPCVGVWTARDKRVKLWATHHHPEWVWLSLTDFSCECCQSLWQKGLQPMVIMEQTAANLSALSSNLKTMGACEMRPLIVEGEERVFPCNTSVIEYGCITLAWGEAFDVERTSPSLGAEWQAHCAQMRQSLITIPALIPHIIAAYSHKLDGMQTRVLAHFANRSSIQIQLSQWQSALSTVFNSKHRQTLVVTDDGETALLMALLYPQQEFVAVVADEEGAAALRRLRCRPDNLYVEE